MRTISVAAFLFYTTSSFAQCPMPTGHQVVDVTSSSFTFGMIYEECGGEVRLFFAGSTTSLETQYPNPDYFEITFLNLQPDTLYDVFVENICENVSSDGLCTSPVSSLSYFFQFQTQPPGCSPPSGLQINTTTTNSLRYQVNIGPDGGKTELRRGSTLEATKMLSPGTQFVTFGGLEDSTSYTACFFNQCGSFYSTPNCQTATTLAECGPPSGFVASNITPFGFTGTFSTGTSGGRAWLFLSDGSTEEFLVGSGRASFNTMDQLTLEPDTQYVICLFNACDEFRTEYSTELCVLVRTPAEVCIPPETVSFSEITANSFKVHSQFGPFGGTARFTSGGFSSEVSFEADETAKAIAIVPSNSQFDVELRNLCFDGSYTDPLTSMVSTLDVTESNGFLTPPSFVSEANIWVEEDLRIHLLLPDPNSDGWAKAQDIRLSYLVRLVQNCEVTFEVELKPNAYPIVYVIPRGIPLEPYEVHVLRQTPDTGKTNHQTSGGSIIVGPPRDAGPSVIPTDFSAIKRWVLHVPKKAGGFQGWLTFQNRFPTLPATLWVAGFDQQGSYLTGTARPVQVIGMRALIPIYSDEQNQSGLFSTAMIDQISHIGMMEQGNLHNLKVSVTYQQVDDLDALSATLPESDFDLGTTLGGLFTMESRKSTNFWDGAAILNLGSSNSATVDIVQRRQSGDSEVARVAAGTVAPGEKKLVVVSDLFSFCDDCYYTVEANDAKAKISVLGLRGSLQSSSAILVGSDVQKKQ